MLTLPIKKKWFDMIKCGDKLEEYRARSPYYESRFSKYMGKEITVKFRNGYRSDSPAIVCLVVPFLAPGRPEWGGKFDEVYWVLYIHNVKAVT